MSSRAIPACRGQSGLLRLDASLLRFVLFLAAPVPRLRSARQHHYVLQDPLEDALRNLMSKDPSLNQYGNSLLTTNATTTTATAAVPKFTRAERREWGMVLELVMRPLTRRLGLWEVARGVRLQVPDAAVLKKIK